jgi:hypothetical protein
MTATTTAAVVTLYNQKLFDARQMLLTAMTGCADECGVVLPYFLEADDMNERKSIIIILNLTHDFAYQIVHGTDVKTSSHGFVFLHAELKSCCASPHNRKHLASRCVITNSAQHRPSVCYLATASWHDCVDGSVHLAVNR